MKMKNNKPVILFVLLLLGLAGCNRNPVNWQEALKHAEKRTELNLISANISSIPDDIGKFVNLEVLNLNYNNLSYLPENISSLSKLKTLCINTNKLTSIPTSIGKLGHLEYISLMNNNLTTLPNEIMCLPRLRILHLEGNPIPEEEQMRIETLLPNTKIYFDFNEHYFPYVYYFNKGLALMQEGKFSYALWYTNKVIKLVPGESDPYLLRGIINYNLNNKQGACADWNKAQQLNNKNAQQYLSSYCQ
jgi:Leucine-rich repeat (LRR) protein